MNSDVLGMVLGLSAAVALGLFVAMLVYRHNYKALQKNNRKMLTLQPEVVVGDGDVVSKLRLLVTNEDLRILGVNNCANYTPAELWVRSSAVDDKEVLVLTERGIPEAITQHRPDRR